MSARITPPQPKSFNYLEDVKRETAGKALTEIFRQLENHTLAEGSVPAVKQPA